MVSLRLSIGLFAWLLLGSSFATSVTPKTAADWSSGTGFAVTNDGHILTSAHLVDSQSFIGVKGFGEQARRRARLIAIDRKLDLALLKINIKTVAIPIGEWGAVTNGQDVVSLGFPNPQTQGESLKITSGIVSSRMGTASNDGIFSFSASVQSGGSGGPVLSMTGSAIGLIHGFSAVNGNPTLLSSNLSYAVNALQLRRFLNRQGVAYVTEVPAQTVLRAQELFERYERSVFLIEAREENPDSTQNGQKSKKDTRKSSETDLPEKLRGLLKTLPEREQPRIYGAYKAGYDQIEEWEDSYILIKTASIKADQGVANTIRSFDSIISYKRERTLSSGEPYLSFMMSARFDCRDLVIEVIRQEFKPEAFGSGISIIAKRKPAEAQTQWSPIRSERRRDIIKAAVCVDDSFSNKTSTPQ